MQYPHSHVEGILVICWWISCKGPSSKKNPKWILDNFEAILIIETRSVLTYRNMERDFTGGWKVVAKNR